MRGLTLGIYMVAVAFIFAQPVIKGNTSTPSTSAVELKIEKTIEENAQKLEEIKVIKAENNEELKNIHKLDEKRRTLMTTIASNIKKLLHKKQQTTIRTVYNQPKQGKNDIIELSKIALDSVCIEEGRSSAFSKKQCIKWEYFKTVSISNDEDLKIKINK